MAPRRGSLRTNRVPIRPPSVSTPPAHARLCRGGSSRHPWPSPKKPDDSWCSNYDWESRNRPQCPGGSAPSPDVSPRAASEEKRHTRPGPGTVHAEGGSRGEVQVVAFHGIPQNASVLHNSRRFHATTGDPAGWAGPLSHRETRSFGAFPGVFRRGLQTRLSWVQVHHPLSTDNPSAVTRSHLPRVTAPLPNDDACGPVARPIRMSPRVPPRLNRNRPTFRYTIRLVVRASDRFPAGRREGAARRFGKECRGGEKPQ